MRDRLGRMLEASGRGAWFDEEMARQLEQVKEPEPGDRWRRVAGTGGFSARELAVLRELGNWRDRRACQINKPAKWVLRDDLLAELAKRRPTSLAELQHTRGIGNIGEARWAKDLIDAIKRGVDLPEDQCPQRVFRHETPDEQMVLKILSAAMIHLARTHRVATGLLGSNEDLRDLMHWQAEGEDASSAPRLARGWRALVCGNHLTDLLKGKVVVRIHNDAGAPRLLFDLDIPTQAGIRNGDQLDLAPDEPSDHEESAQ
jgi:ribonuclease D